MGQVILGKKAQDAKVNEDEMSVEVSDPNIKSQIVELTNKINRIQQDADNQINTIKQQIAQLQKKDAEQQKTNAVNNVQNQANTQQNNGQAFNESAEYAFRKAMRLSKRLYESAKLKKAELAVEILDMMNELDLSYTLNQKECDNLARKIIDVIDNDLSSKTTKNQWSEIQKEIKKYFRNNSISLSSDEKEKLIGRIKDHISSMPEYDWIFGTESAASDLIDGAENNYE